MTPTRVPTLLGLAATAFGLVLVIIRAVDTGLQRPPVGVVVTVAVLAAAVVGVAASLRTRLAGRPGTRPVTPLGVARMAALGIAAALTGALLTGGWAGLFADRLTRAGTVSAARSDAVVAGAGVLVAVGLTAAGLLLQWICRTGRGSPRLR